VQKKLERMILDNFSCTDRVLMVVCNRKQYHLSSSEDSPSGGEKLMTALIGDSGALSRPVVMVEAGQGVSMDQGQQMYHGITLFFIRKADQALSISLSLQAHPGGASFVREQAGQVVSMDQGQNVHLGEASFVRRNEQAKRSA
jgi:hypothetical protein